MLTNAWGDKVWGLRRVPHPASLNTVLPSILVGGNLKPLLGATFSFEMKMFSFGMQDERSRVKEMQDGAYHRLQAIKQQSRGKKDAYYQNRRFSQDVCAPSHLLLLQ